MADRRDVDRGFADADLWVPVGVKALLSRFEQDELLVELTKVRASLRDRRRPTSFRRFARINDLSGIARLVALAEAERTLAEEAAVPLIRALSANADAVAGWTVRCRWAGRQPLICDGSGAVLDDQECLWPFPPLVWAIALGAGRSGDDVTATFDMDGIHVAYDMPFG